MCKHDEYWTHDTQNEGGKNPINLTLCTTILASMGSNQNFSSDKFKWITAVYSSSFDEKVCSLLVGCFLFFISLFFSLVSFCLSTFIQTNSLSFATLDNDFQFMWEMKLSTFRINMHFFSYYFARFVGGCGSSGKFDQLEHKT